MKLSSFGGLDKTQGPKNFKKTGRFLERRNSWYCGEGEEIISENRFDRFSS